MSEKRFFILKDEEYDDVLPCIRDRKRELDDIYGHYKYDDINQICDLLNALHEENQQLKRADNIADLETQIMHLKQENQELKLQLNQCSDQRNEFHRGARENANRVGKLEKENEQLKHDATVLICSNQEYRKENEQLKSENMMVTGANKILKENNKRLKEEIKDLNDVLARYEEKVVKE